jgi:hypothetical protein
MPETRIDDLSTDDKLNALFALVDELLEGQLRIEEKIDDLTEQVGNIQTDSDSSNREHLHQKETWYPYIRIRGDAEKRRMRVLRSIRRNRNRAYFSPFMVPGRGTPTTQYRLREGSLDKFVRSLPKV